MAMYLGKTDDKVAAIVATAENAGVDPVRIQTVCDPVYLHCPALLSALHAGPGPYARCCC